MVWQGAVAGAIYVGFIVMHVFLCEGGLREEGQERCTSKGQLTAGWWEHAGAAPTIAVYRHNSPTVPVAVLLRVDNTQQVAETLIASHSVMHLLLHAGVGAAYPCQPLHPRRALLLLHSAVGIRLQAQQPRVAEHSKAVSHC